MRTRGNPTVTEHPPQPLFPNRILNTIGRFRRPLVSDPEDLMQRAATATGLDDFGGEDFLPALEVCCRSLNDDREMSYVGRIAARRFNLRLLMDRLRIQVALKEDPGITRHSVDAPILIFGNARSGTTLLQRLMAQDPQFRVLLGWEAYCATSPPDPDAGEENPGFQEAVKLFDLFERTSPALFITHPMAPTLPEECWYLLERQFIRPLTALFWEIPEYWEWLWDRSEDDLTGDLVYYKKQLQILQRKTPDARWLLKPPLHAMFLVPFARNFPDIRLVQCHRDPHQTLPSGCSLVAARKTAYYSSIDFPAVGEKCMRHWERGMERMLSSRARLGEDRFSDVSFSRLMNDPIPTVQGLYRSLGLRLSAEVEGKMRAFLASQRSGKHTRHRYSLEEFGLEEGAVEERFAMYRAEFGKLF